MLFVGGRQILDVGFEEKRIGWMTWFISIIKVFCPCQWQPNWCFSKL